MRKRTLHVFVSLIALLVLCGCQREQWRLDQERAGVSFSAGMSSLSTKSSATYFLGHLPLEDAAPGDTLGIFCLEGDFPARDSVKTKAGIYSGTSLPSSVSLGVVAYKYASAGASVGAWTLHSSPAVVEARYDGSRGGDSSGKWLPSTRILWPETGYVRFFGYAPYGSASVSASGGSAPQLSFTVASGYQDQVDLLVADAASTSEREGNPPVTAIDVPMTFDHALTGIRFRVAKGLSVSSISVNGVYSQGSLSLYDNASHAWSGQSAKASYTLSSPSLVSEDSSYDRLADQYTLLLLPQTLPEGARIVATVTSGGVTKTITAVMDGLVWSPGKLITYTISGTSEGDLVYTLSSLSSVTSLSYKGASGNLSTALMSYVTGPAGEFPVPYVLEYSSTSNGSSGWSTTPPSWLSVSSPSSFQGSVTGEKVTVTVAPQVNSASSSSHTALSSRSAKTDFDLSTVNVATGATVARSTANCYVVQAPGTYRLPLVYGNALKDGSPNPEAYTASSGSGILTPFKNHLDYDITGPYIVPQMGGKTLTGALLWTDVPGLVCDVSLSGMGSGDGSGCYLNFSVPSETINQGNAVVGLLADGEVAWSWHIWVTDADLTVVQEGPSGHRFSPANLGWCDGGQETYASRTYYVRAVQQAEGGKTSATRTVSQSGTSVSTGGNNPFYEWGRKDPLQASAGSGTTSKTYYSSQDAYKPGFASGAKSLGESVRTPSKGYYTLSDATNYDWCTPSWLNLWSDDVKTVYDPSPSGFRVPPGAALSGFTASNLVWVTSPGTGRRYGTALFFPASGYRPNGSNLSLTSVGASGSYWSAGRASGNKKIGSLLFSSSSASVSEVYAANGNSVRPVVDEELVRYTWHLSVVPPAGLKPEGGSSSNGQISSYRTNDITSQNEAAPWTVTGYYSDAACTTPYNGSNASTRPAWLTSITASGSGSVPGASEALSATVSASSYSTVTQDAETTISNIIGGNGIRGSESLRWNLANPSSPYSNYVAESANCYIVNARGYYRIPLVMGNGMVNNAINSTASTYKGASGTYSILFQDYTGSNTTNPKLHKSSSGAGSPSSAFVVWEDVNGLIEAGSNYTLPNALEYDSAADLWWLNFHVDKAQQGNAVIAVANASGNVMWSWHIWVTHYDQTNVTIMSDYDFANYNLMLMNLGWLPSGSGTVRIYSPRTVYVKIQQADGGEEAVMALTQPGKTVYTTFPTGGKGPYWQWGRKDAMWPSGTCYGRFASVSTLTSRQSLANAIKNPGKFIATGESSCWSSYSQPGNLWDSATKTIWDPCPAGYTVPSQAAITLVFNQWPDNVAVGTFNRGWHFYNSARTGTVFFPAAGLRTATSGAVAEAGSTGNYWNDLMRTGDSGGSLWYFYDQWAFTAALSRSYGLSIRPKKR